MKHTLSLPEPDADALAHSQKLLSRIKQEITAHDGAISFRRYMEMALYEPALGYYVAGAHKIGEQGDFITAPEISALYSRCLANQCAEVIANTHGDLLELGAGSGTMACDILLELEKQQALPEHYYILDLSPDLKQRQYETLQKHAPQLLEKVSWLTSLPDAFNGIIIGNEVLDAMPVDVFTQHNEQVYEHHVIVENDKLLEQLRPANDDLHQQVMALNIPLDATPYTSEINPSLDGWFTSIAASLKQGVVLLIDYGYPHSEYYLPERNKGTLICHYQHLVNEAPLHYPGLQDITASVDFSAVAQSADKAGLNVAGFNSQAAFLSNAGLEAHFMQALDAKPDDQYKLAQQVRTLSLPSEMGERFKFIALTKDYNKPLQGFAALDQRYRL
jgi:SAM-dependent MidA family methyltransferase